VLGRVPRQHHHQCDVAGTERGEGGAYLAMGSSFRAYGGSINLKNK
jgi:hypothetical protein